MDIGNNIYPAGIKPPEINVGYNEIPLTGIKPIQIDVGYNEKPDKLKPPEVDVGHNETIEKKKPKCCPNVPKDITPPGGDPHQIVPPHLIQIDETLTKPGWAADAAVTGYLIRHLGAPVFFVEYGQTTLQEILDADAEEKVITCLIDDKTYFLSSLDQNGATLTATYEIAGHSYTQTININSSGVWSSTQPVELASVTYVNAIIDAKLQDIDIVDGNVW